MVAPRTKNSKVTKTKRPRKLDRKIVLYVPDSFDPEVHLPEQLRHLADYARYLLHRIIVGRVHQRRGNNLVPLKYDYLVKFIPEAHYLAIRDALIDSDVIHVRKFCVPGEIAYGFRLLYPPRSGILASGSRRQTPDHEDPGMAQGGITRDPSASPPRLEEAHQGADDRRGGGIGVGAGHSVPEVRPGQVDPPDRR